MRTRVSRFFRSTLALATFGVFGYAHVASAQGNARKSLRDPARCDSVADTLLAVNQSIKGLEGRYRLILVKTDSVRLPNGVFSGNLFLWKASPNDSSHDGRRPRPWIDAGNFYFGTTNVDLDAVEAYAGYFGNFWRTKSDPIRSDVDPIRPPILGIVRTGNSNGTHWKIFWLAVGTLANARDTGGDFDGMGIGLDVKKINSRGLFGTWGPFGIVKTGRGYFCAYHEHS